MPFESVRSGSAAAPAASTALSRWERRTEWPLIGLSVLFFVLYAWTVLDPGMSPELQRVVDVVMWLTWAIFAADYVIRLVLATDRGSFLLRNVFDLVVILVPILRQLRVLRLVMVLVLLNRRVQARVRGQVVVYVAGATVLLGMSAALAALDAERGAPDATITGFTDALWWTMTTITTVGYGDYYPVTALGKLIAAGLMLAGIALLGVVTGSIASWFVEKFGGMEQTVERAGEASSQSAAEAERLRGEIASLTSEIAALRERLSDGSALDSTLR